MSRTKIVCTIGPSSNSKEIISELVNHGMDVARLNFSHGTHKDHGEKIKIIRDISQENNKPIAILQDLCGPKIRIREIENPGIRLVPGQDFILTNQYVKGTINKVSVSYFDLPKEVKQGDIILLADGMMELRVKSKTANDIVCEVITGGVLTSHKGINLPSGTIKAPALTDKDKKDLFFGLDNGVDFVALSFVRNADDIRQIQKIIKDRGKDTPVIAKIEKHEALNCIDEILEIADGIMVARGDLGVEIPLETVPNIQKMLIKKANQAGRPVIVATQMLRSMVDSPRPTRAEATDVANAVLEGADAIMLSEETASGKYPIKAVSYMNDIATNAEKHYPHKRYLNLITDEISETVAYAACIVSDHLHAKVIVTPTKSGFTAKQISRLKPDSYIIALSPDINVVRRLCLYWGCKPALFSQANNTDEMLENGAKAVLEAGYVSKGDLIVITAGHPVWVKGTTNMVKVKRI